MLPLPRAPHADEGSEGFLGIAPIRALGHRIRVALEHDERGGAGRMSRCEQRRRSEGAGVRDEDRFAAPEVASTAVMLSAHCSKVGSAPGVTGSDAPVPG